MYKQGKSKQNTCRIIHRLSRNRDKNPANRNEFGVSPVCVETRFLTHGRIRKMSSEQEHQAHEPAQSRRMEVDGRPSRLTCLNFKAPVRKILRGISVPLFCSTVSPLKISVLQITPFERFCGRTTMLRTDFKQAYHIHFKPGIRRKNIFHIK